MLKFSIRKQSREVEMNYAFRLLIDCEIFYQKDATKLKKITKRVLSQNGQSLPHFEQKKEGDCPLFFNQ